jgi:hypothetical protein
MGANRLLFRQSDIQKIWELGFCLPTMIWVSQKGLDDGLRSTLQDFSLNMGIPTGRKISIQAVLTRIRGLEGFLY